MHKFLGLKKSTHRRNVRDFVDQDYTHLLTDEDKEWLSRFNNEYYKSFFPKNQTHLHHSPELKKNVYGLKNSRNRDLYAIKGCSNMLASYEEQLHEDLDSNGME